MAAQHPLPNDGFDLSAFLTSGDLEAEDSPLLDECPTGLYPSEAPVVLPAPARRAPMQLPPPVGAAGGELASSRQRVITPPPLPSLSGERFVPDPDPTSFPNPFPPKAPSSDQVPIIASAAVGGAAVPRLEGRGVIRAGGDARPPAVRAPRPVERPVAQPGETPVMPARRSPAAPGAPASAHPAAPPTPAVEAAMARRLAAASAAADRAPAPAPAAPAPLPSAAAAAAAGLAKLTAAESRDVELLLKKGKAAFEAERFGLAAAFFQRAYQAAPFRDDIKRWLQQALEEQAQEAATGAETASRGAPGIYYRHEVEAVLRGGRETRSPSPSTPTTLPATTKRGMIPWRGGLFRWVWGSAVAVVLLIIGLAGWPVLAAAAGRLIDLRSPEVREAQRMLADALEAEGIGRLDAARATLSQALSLEGLDEELRATLRTRLAEVAHREGNKHFLDNAFDEAASAFEVAIEARGDVALYHGDLAMTRYLAAKGSWSRLRGNGAIDKAGLRAALASFERALELEPGRVAWLWSAADCHVRMGNTPLAIDFWKEIVQSDDPDDASYVKEARKALQGHGIRM